MAEAKARPTAHAYVVSAELLARHGNHVDALADAERAIALEPNNPDAHISKASVLNVLGRAEEAEASARWALRLDPHHRPGHLRVRSIPIVADLDRRLDAPAILMGLGLNDDNLHAPNEKMELDNFYRGIEASAFLMEELAADSGNGRRPTRAGARRRR